MKNIFKLFSLIMVLLVTMVACEEETEWYSDYNGDGDVYAQFTDTNFDFGLFLNADLEPVTPESFPVYVRLVGPTQKSDVSVGIKITQSTGANGEWTIANRVATIAAGSLSGSVMVQIDREVTKLDSTYVIEIEIDEATTTVPVYGNVASTATITVMRGLSCDMDYEMFSGDYFYKTIWDYDPNPASTVTPDEDNAMLAIETIWDEMAPVNFTLDVGDEIATNVYELSADNQADVWHGDLTSWGLSTDCDFDFDGFNSGKAYSCTGEFTFKCTPYLVDNGAGATYWWGGEMTFEFVPGTPGKKAAMTVTDSQGGSPKLVRIK